MNEDKKLLWASVAFGVCFFILGALFGVCMIKAWDLYNKKPAGEVLVGQYTVRNDGPYKGEWVHVKIDGMKYEDIAKTCIHEAGHELFAEMCEKSPQECFKVAQAMEQRWLK